MNVNELLKEISEDELAQVALELLAQLEGQRPGSAFMEQGPRKQSGDGPVINDGSYAVQGYSARPEDGRFAAADRKGRDINRYERNLDLVRDFGGDADSGAALFDGSDISLGMSRLQFLRHRGIETETAAEKQALARPAAEDHFQEVLTESQVLGQSHLPEMISEQFCRDARRYDGAYERY